jgi:3-dehydroquinate synthase
VVNVDSLSVSEVVAKIKQLLAAEQLTKIEVNLEQNSYPIFIANGLLKSLEAHIQSLNLPTRQAVIVTNPVVGRFWGKLVQEQLKQAFQQVAYQEIPAGERYKSWRTALKLYDYLLTVGADRQTVLVALGGGVIGDLVGFVAATFMRGVPYLQLPTTLMAQVDSSIGGKTAVNHRLAKNIIGAFYQPKAVFIDPLVLKTLPRRELKNGLSEVIKYAFIANKPAVQTLVNTLGTPYLSKVLDWLIAQSVAVKAKIVSEDEKEQGLRAVLNYGHTIGHALEAVTSYQRLGGGRGRGRRGRGGGGGAR